MCVVFSDDQIFAIVGLLEINPKVASSADSKFFQSDQSQCNM